jgi:MFS family permease
MKEKKDLSYRWIIVAASFVILALVFGVWYSFSVFFVALLREFGWSRSMGAGAFSLVIVISNLVGPFVGSLTYSAGARKVLITGALILGAGLALCSLTRTWWQYYLFLSVVTAVGVGTTGWVPNITLIQLWFAEKRGLAVGIISSGVGVGILVCVPSIQYLMDQVGWRMAYRVMALFVPSVVIFMAVLFLKRPPAETQTFSVEKKAGLTMQKDPLVVDEIWVSRPWTARKAMTTKLFWLLGVSFFLGNFIAQSIFTHQVAFFVDHGLEALFASYLVGIVGVVSFGSKILWGVLSDRIGREVTYAMGITCYILGMIILILFDLSPSYRLTYIYAVLFGMGYSVTAALPPLIAADVFEGPAYGSIFGSIMIFVGAGGAIGAWFAGFLYDQMGSYVSFFILTAVFALVSSLSVWKAAPRKIRRVPGKRDRVKD